jgi:hypothetical protein
MFTQSWYSRPFLLSGCAELNSMFPNISFTLSDSTGPVNIRPSSYMVRKSGCLDIYYELLLLDKEITCKLLFKDEKPGRAWLSK